MPSAAILRYGVWSLPSGNSGVCLYGGVGWEARGAFISAIPCEAGGCIPRPVILSYAPRLARRQPQFLILRWPRKRPSKDAGRNARAVVLRGSLSLAPQDDGQQETFPRRIDARGLRHQVTTTKGGEAPKGAPSIGRACIGKRRRCRARQRAYRSPLAFRRFAAALVAASERRNSAQAVLRATERTQALPAPSIALKRSTPRAGRTAGGNDARTARERGYKPRPQEPHSPHPSAVTGRRP